MNAGSGIRGTAKRWEAASFGLRATYGDVIALKVTDLSAVAADLEVELVTPNFERRILRAEDDVPGLADGELGFMAEDTGIHLLAFRTRNRMDATFELNTRVV